MARPTSAVARRAVAAPTNDQAPAVRGGPPRPLGNRAGGGIPRAPGRGLELRRCPVEALVRHRGTGWTAGGGSGAASRRSLVADAHGRRRPRGLPPARRAMV